METNQSTHGPAPSGGRAKRHFTSFNDALHSAKVDACARAGETAPRMKSALGEVARDVAYGTVYGTAFGVVFVGAVAGEFVPAQLRDRLARGARAGCDTARSVRDKVRATLEPRPPAREVVVETAGEPAGA